MMTEIVRCAFHQIAHAHGFEMQHTNGTEIWNVAYLFDLFCIYEANVVTEIPKMTANE